MKKLFKYIFICLLTLVGSVLTYTAFAYLLSAIKTGKTAQNEPVTLFVKSNGVHTDIVLPVKHQNIDWSKLFPFHHTKSKDSSAKYIAVGWGDKGFYLNTPTWNDLTFSTAFNAITGRGGTALHITYYQEISETESCKKFTVSEHSYRQLTDYIRSSLATNNKGYGNWINTSAVYGMNDAFYEAKGKYSLFHTCNTWTNNALKSCHQRACVWTPFAKGVLEACSETAN